MARYLLAPFLRLPDSFRLDASRDREVSAQPYGLHYNADENTWALYGTVLQLKKTSVYGRPGQIAQIEYCLDGGRSRDAWIVVQIDHYSFSDDTRAVTIGSDQGMQLCFSREHVSLYGVDAVKLTLLAAGVGLVLELFYY